MKFEDLGGIDEKYIANIITSCRILCSIIMMFFPVFSVMFYIMYLLFGLTDMIDGAILQEKQILLASLEQKWTPLRILYL